MYALIETAKLNGLDPKLLSAIERHLARTGITSMRLACLAANASAQAAYQKAGYEPYEIVYEKRIRKQSRPAL